MSPVPDWQVQSLDIDVKTPLIRYNAQRMHSHIPRLNLCLLRAKMLCPQIIGAPGYDESMSPAYQNLYDTICDKINISNHTSLLFTSHEHLEGKTIHASNFAIQAARQGIRSLLIDSNLHCPVLDFLFLGAHCMYGLTYILEKHIEWHDAVRETGFPNLDLLPAGRMIDERIDAINSSAMSALIHLLIEEYDLLVLDCPPLQHGTGTLFLAGIVDKMVLITGSGNNITRINETVTSLPDHVQDKILGYITNSFQIPRDNTTANDGYA